MDELTIGLIALCLAGLGIILAGFFGVFRAISLYLDKRYLKQQYQEALVEDQLIEALNELYFAPSTPASHRHNIHCPSCGRFSKKVLGMTDVVECKAHGVQVRWKDIPVTDWATQPIAEGVTLVTAPIPIIFQPLGVEAPEEPVLEMQPIDHRRLVQLIPEAA